MSTESTHIVVMDCGVKRSIPTELMRLGARVTVVPLHTCAEDILRLNPKGLLISNGPGDPQPLKNTVSQIQKLLGKLPMLGICLGHQLLALALGAKTHKLKFGHHGANHPVRNERSRRVEITSQNHGFAVDGDSLASIDGKTFGLVRVSHVHLSDATIEGFEAPDIKVMAIQYHPEAAPGPHDAKHIFGEFLECTKHPLSG